jgi:hypothetical protein
MKKNIRKQKRKALRSGKIFNRYQVVSSSTGYNLGAFPPSDEGLIQARAWSVKMAEETGGACSVEKR